MASSRMTATFARPPDEVWEAVAGAVTGIGIGASVAEMRQQDRWLKAFVSISFWSWGEVLELTVRPHDGGSQVTVESKSRFPLTLVDWGKNSRNVAGVLGRLKALVA